jgi:tetratricopeptide (TPR) repeat protein
VERSKERPDYVFKFERRVVPHLDAAIRCAQNYLTDQGSLEKLSVPADYWTYGGLGQLLLNIEGFYLWGQWLLQEGLLHLEQRLLGRITLFRYHWRQIYKLAYILPLETRREVYRLCLLEAWKALPRKHPWALEVAGDLSWTILNQNIPYCCVIPSHHADQAWEWYNWTLSARRAVLGRSHPATMGAVKGIGQVLEAKCMFPEALKELEKALSVRAHYLGYGDILTRNVIDDVTVLFQQWHECEGPGLEQALFEYLNKTKDIGEYQLVPSRIDLINIYNSLTHVSHEINERNGLATCQGLLLANKLSKPSDRFLWSELQTVIIEVAESLDGDAALPCVLFYLEEMSEAILSRSRRLDDVTYMGRIDSSPSLDLSLYWVIDVVSFKLKELGELEASLDLCQRLLKLLDQLDEEEYSENFLATSKLAIFVSWDLAKTLNSLGRTEEAFKMSDRARLGWRLFISMPKFFYWDPPMWTETAKWYERLGRYDLAVGLYMELIGLSKVIRWYPDAKWETIKELYVTIARAYHASGDLYKTLGWIYLILKEPTNTVASAEVNAEFHREAINGMFNEDGNQEQELFSQELRLIVTQGRPHLFETSFCPGAFDIWPWEGEDHLVCDSFAPSPYATYSRTCPAVYLPTVLDRAMIIKEQNSLLDLLFAAEGHWSDYV